MVDRAETPTGNLEDITKALEDMDSLDMELFNDSFKKPKSSNVQLDGEIKKKVVFKESNEDDLLSGLLSDEETSIKEKKNLFATGSKSSVMEDLFKIKSPAASMTSIKSSNEPQSKTHFEQEEITQFSSQKPSSYVTSKSNFTSLQSEPTKERNVQKSKNVAGSKDDILASLFDKSDARRSSLRESLFENKSHSSSVMDSMIPRNIGKSESEAMIQTTSLQDTKVDPTDLSTKFFTREPRRGRRNTKVINDPLGLLSGDLLADQNLELMANENAKAKNSVTQNTKSEKDLPEWLGGSKTLEDTKLEPRKEEIVKIDKVSTSKQNIEVHNVNSAVDSKVSGTDDSEGASIFPEQFSLLFGSQLNQQSALMNMQQQEYELRTAAMLSQQSEQLSKVSQTQQSMLHNQEEQFSTLLKLQFERQALLEKQIKLQQERINQYIHALMTQPVSSVSQASVNVSCKSDLCEKEKEDADEKEEMENAIKRLEGEKSKLEIKLSIINEKHDNEITYQAEFYERQISFLKEAIGKIEERVKQEIECLETDYMAKFEKLKDEKLQTEKQYKEEIHNLKNEHAQRIEELCKIHSENVKLLQKEYSDIIESILKAKQTEDETIQAVTSRKNDVEEILQKASTIIKSMVDSKKELESEHNQIMELQKNVLKMHEDDLKTQKLELKHHNSVLEEHRNKFIETTEGLDIRLTQLITELQKQSTLCNQAQETLERKAANLLRERELFEEKMKWERDYMQALKESWIKEQEKQLRLLGEEKEAIATKKAQLEVLNKLKTNNGEIARIELETAIKTAQEAIASANREKLKWQEKINELNVQKQILEDKEDLLILRAKELENLTQSALSKREEGMKALKNAKHLEIQNKEKFNQLQVQIQALMDREKKVATERYNITKGRMISLRYDTEKPEKDINVSHDFQDHVIPFSEIHSKPEIDTELMSMVDPNLIMLKLNLHGEFDDSLYNKYV